MHLFSYWNLQLTWVDMLIWSNILLESCLKWGEGWFDYIQNRYRDSLHSKSLLDMCSSVLVFGGQAVQGCWHHLGAWIRLWWNIYIYLLLSVCNVPACVIWNSKWWRYLISTYPQYHAYWAWFVLQSQKRVHYYITFVFMATVFIIHVWSLTEGTA